MSPKRIELWASMPCPHNPFVAPEVIDHLHVVGQIDGKEKITSRLVTAVGRLVTTRTGSVYELGEPRPEFVEWCAKRGAPIDPAQPIKLRPTRIQLSRRPGWRKPAGAVVVSRPTRWGNPYKLDAYKFQNGDGTPAAWDEKTARELAIRDFEGALAVGGILPFTVADVRRELAGKVLACWCRLSAPCHADVLLEIANEREPES